MASENILHRIRGADVARAQSTLPPAESSPVLTIDAVADVGDHGRVCITFVRVLQRRHRSRRVFWVADRAVRVEPEHA
jgi:hypothetical protein